MTRVSRDFGDTMQKDAVPPISTDVAFGSKRFPNYKIGSNNQIVDAKDDPKIMSMKEVVARETALLLDHEKRLSVRDLASKFEKGLAAAAKLSEEARLREAASLEKHVLLKKLRDALDSLKGRVTGRNKEDEEEAIAMVEALAIQLTERESELVQEKAEVKNLANFLKQKMLRSLLMRKELLLVQKLRVPGQPFKGWKKPFKNMSEYLELLGNRMSRS